MLKQIINVLTSNKFIEKIQNKLPAIFQVINSRNKRGGKIGPEVGIMRERALVGLLINFFGKNNVNYDLPANLKEIDVLIFNQPISIKTMTSKSTKIPSFKLTWSADNETTSFFIQNYEPSCHLFICNINWNGYGGLYFIPQKIQQKVISQIGREFYCFTKPNTNSRGISISKKAINLLIENEETIYIQIYWNQNSELDYYDHYKEWIEIWNE